MAYHKISVSEPWWTHINNGDKVIEGRLNKGIFSQLNVGDTVKWFIKDNENTHSVLTKIEQIKKYNTFEEMLEKSTLKKTLPGIKKMSDGIQIYRQFYSPEKEKQFGVLAIKIKKL